MAKKYRSIRFELLKILMGTSILTVLIIGATLSIIFFRQLFKQAKEDMDFYVESVNKEVKKHLEFLEELIIYLRNNEELNIFLKEDSGDKKEIEQRLERSINLFASSNIVDGSYPVVRNIHIFTKDLDSLSIDYYPVSSIEEKETEKRMKSILLNYIDSGREFVFYRYGNRLELYLKLYDDNMEAKAYCVVVFSKNSFNEIFSKLNRYDNYACGVLSQGKFLFGQSFNEEPKDIANLEAGEISFKGKKYYLQKEYYGFSLSTYILIPKDSLYTYIVPSFRLAYFLSLSLLIGIFAVIFFVSKRISKPLREIIDKFKIIGTGDFSARLDEYSIEEFRDISVSFNEMANKIDHLIKEVYEAQLLAKESRIQYLQAQINPHFMFNVLSMISIRLKLKNDKEVYPLVSAFAGLMQGKLFRKNEIEIQLKDEIEIVSFYLYLSEARFRENISYKIQWEDESLKECYIPRLCIEPIVENAMIHGIEPKKDKGHISLIISKKENKIEVLVEDDGIGFDINEAQNSQKSPRVGIMNIQRLIYNLYGEEYGIKVESKINIGTKVYISLPFKTERTI